MLLRGTECRAYHLVRLYITVGTKLISIMHNIYLQTKRKEPGEQTSPSKIPALTNPSPISTESTSRNEILPFPLAFADSSISPNNLGNATRHCSSERPWLSASRAGMKSQGSSSSFDDWPGVGVGHCVWVLGLLGVFRMYFPAALPCLGTVRNRMIVRRERRVAVVRRRRGWVVNWGIDMYNMK